ncbi:apicomplexan specific coiled coil protein [Cryptosporidium ryanae]|uniref:apicomplexan specific coiled coil protein n=1 Tax=Cryptosporidium ryanae TaxID=515981 RepID=UPI00351A3AAD|nr:apicomplexan specific coiled coil protein [Cryptosporidium ryanae]
MDGNISSSKSGTSGIPPMSFSPEIQGFIVTKFDPLLSIVKELNDHVQSSDKERLRLEYRISRIERTLESLIKIVTDLGYKLPEDNEFEKNIPELKSELSLLLSGEESVTAPWLFSVQSGTPISSLQILLEFSQPNTEVLLADTWRREEDMWISFLDDLPDEFSTRRPESLSLVDLRRAARKALLEVIRGELLLVIRNVPGKQEVPHNPLPVTLVAILAAAFSEAWERVESSDPNSLGRLALVLEGDNIGSRLRAGKKKFAIEALN